MPASGKSTISIVLAETFIQKGINVKVLFGDNFANISYGCKYAVQYSQYLRHDF